MLQENVQQQLVQVLNTKNSNSSNKNVNVINISSPNYDQKNVNVCDSLSIAKEQKCAAPKASKISNCEKISVGKVMISVREGQGLKSSHTSNRLGSSLFFAFYQRYIVFLVLIIGTL